ncbi:hypothetical protein HYFRA_00007788 [Hymenoscyphus fraxineus]|uniref:Uncharacterized protein n=1 Tax=Hymenoscyphus fraxineus TaxID=746836 RepID=A0A9N9KKV7_9HELO|nr:hypothetical protein HYFRA_00007788 [Hymenoscyphus fraxineus]
MTMDIPTDHQNLHTSLPYPEKQMNTHPIQPLPITHSHFLFRLHLVHHIILHPTKRPVGYAICQASCATLVVVCYSLAGFFDGTVTTGMATPAVQACNAAFGTCQHFSVFVLLGAGP